MNDKFVQIKGPFKENEDIIKKIKKKYDVNFNYIRKIGIQAKRGDYCRINNRLFELGEDGRFEFCQVQVSSLSFLQYEPESTYIDCVLE